MNERKTNVNPSVITVVPYNMDANKYNATVFEICNLFQTKDLTIKQAQSVLHCCEEMLLYSVVNIHNSIKEIEEGDIEKMNDKEKKILNRVISKFANEIPADADIELLSSQLREIRRLLQIKGLTVKQAQLLLKMCSEYILDCTLI